LRDGTRVAIRVPSVTCLPGRPDPRPAGPRRHPDLGTRHGRPRGGAAARRASVAKTWRSIYRPWPGAAL